MENAIKLCETVPTPVQPDVDRAFLRPLITPILEKGGEFIKITIDWIVTGPGNELGKDPEDTSKVSVKLHEEYRIAVVRVGCGVVSDVGVPAHSSAVAGLVPFFVDSQGLRHFRVEAERCDMRAEALPLG